MLGGVLVFRTGPGQRANKDTQPNFEIGRGGRPIACFLKQHLFTVK